MRVKVILPCILAVLAMLIMAPAHADNVKPVLIMTDYKVVPGASLVTTSPGPLMPGDTGTVAVTITNTLKSPGTGTTTQQTNTENYYAPSTGAPGPGKSVQTTTTSSDTPSGCTTLKLVSLQGVGPIKVISEPYVNPGCLGMGDSAPFAFRITVDQDASPGTYELPFTVKTDDDGVYLNQRVFVVVDDSGVRLIVNDAPATIGAGKSSVVLDVINYMKGGVSSVSVIPVGDAFSFNPVQEYMVGSIGPDEMYTVTFDVSCRNSSYSGSPSFIVKYKNGDNWHQWGPVSLNLDPAASAVTAAATDSSAVVYLLGGIALLAVTVGGLFLFMRGKRAKK